MSALINDVLKLLGELFKNEPVQNTLRYARIGGAFVGGLATVGGLLLGPAGLLAGGGVGSVSAYLWTSGRFQSLPELWDDLIACIQNLGSRDYAQLLILLLRAYSSGFF